MGSDRLGLEGEFNESELPLLIRRAGMAEWDEGLVRILDRRALPLVEKYLECRTAEEVALAIEEMVIQGAFSLSIAAGYGLALAVKTGQSDLEAIHAAADRLLRTRPTGLALKRMIDACVQRAEGAIIAGNSAAKPLSQRSMRPLRHLRDRAGKRANAPPNSSKMAAAS